MALFRYSIANQILEHFSWEIEFYHLLSHFQFRKGEMTAFWTMSFMDLLGGKAGLVQY